MHSHPHYLCPAFPRFRPQLITSFPPLQHVSSTTPPTPSFSYSYSYRGAPAPLGPSSPNGADAAHDAAETETIGIPYAATRPHASHLPAVIVDAYDLNYSSVDRRHAREAALPALNTGAGHGAPLVQPGPSISASPSAEPEHETEEGGTASSSATPSPAIAFAPPESPSTSASTSHTPFSSHDTPASPSASRRPSASAHTRQTTLALAPTGLIIQIR